MKRAGWLIRARLAGGGNPDVFDCATTEDSAEVQFPDGVGPVTSRCVPVDVPGSDERTERCELVCQLASRTGSVQRRREASPRSRPRGSMSLFLRLAPVPRWPGLAVVLVRVAPHAPYPWPGWGRSESLGYLEAEASVP